MPLDNPIEEIATSTTQPTTSQDSPTAFGTSSAFATKEDVQRSQNFLMAIIVGIVVFIVVTFWFELFTTHKNYEQDKSLMLQNNQLNKDYFDKVLFLNNEIQDLKIQFEVLMAKNSYLK